VYTEVVKNITLSADEELIERARLRAAREKRTLNAAFRDWLQCYAGPETGHHEYSELMKQLGHVRNTRHLSRDEMNER
jgi:plasmid stability protein